LVFTIRLDARAGTLCCKVLFSGWSRRYRRPEDAIELHRRPHEHLRASFLTALGIAGLAALGGAVVVYSGFDDAPGGILIGLVLIVGAVALGWKAGQRCE